MSDEFNSPNCCKNWGSNIFHLAIHDERWFFGCPTTPKPLPLVLFTTMSIERWQLAVAVLWSSLQQLSRGRHLESYAED